MCYNRRTGMEHNLWEAMGSLKRLFSFGVATYSLFILTFLNACPILNKQSSSLQIDMFGIKAHLHYYSLIFALLYSAFTMLILAGVDLLRTTAERYQDLLKTDSESEIITLYPWMASPFHERPGGSMIFWGFLLFAYANCAWLAFAHLSGLNAPSTDVIETWV
jgi:hypothetical protein